MQLFGHRNMICPGDRKIIPVDQIHLDTRIECGIGVFALRESEFRSLGGVKQEINVLVLGGANRGTRVGCGIPVVSVGHTNNQSITHIVRTRDFGPVGVVESIRGVNSCDS